METVLHFEFGTEHGIFTDGIIEWHEERIKSVKCGPESFKNSKKQAEFLGLFDAYCPEDRSKYKTVQGQLYSNEWRGLSLFVSPCNQAVLDEQGKGKVCKKNADLYKSMYGNMIDVYIESKAFD